MEIFLFHGRVDAIVHAITFRSESMQRLPTMDSFSLAVFAEIGDAWNTESHKSHLFSRLSGADWLIDGGFSLLFLDGFVRVDLARQLRGGDGSWRFTMRLVDKL